MVIAVGGNSRKAGKTAVICALIRALPDANWTAIKISPHGHSDDLGLGRDRRERSISSFRGPLPLVAAQSRQGGDTGRFLAAGAKRAVLLSEIPADWPSGNVIVESGSVRDADVHLLVIDTSSSTFKESARALIASADAFVVTGGEWDGSGRPVFDAKPPLYESAELTEYVRAKLIGQR